MSIYRPPFRFYLGQCLTEVVKGIVGVERSSFSSLIILAALGSIATLSVQADTLDPCKLRAASAYSESAFFVPVDRAEHLQLLLDTHEEIKLQPGNDYSLLPSLTVRSNQKIFGLAGTRVPRIIVEPGSHSILLSDISSEEIFFPPSKKITHHNCFFRVGSIRSDGGNLEKNTFVGIDGKVNINNHSQGFARNNWFIRTKIHAAYPSIQLLGNTASPSRGNLFVWTNVLTPHGDGIIIKKQLDVSFVGLDSESWNWNNRAKYPAMFNVSETNFVHLFMPNGGDRRQKKGRYFYLDADEVLIQGMRIENNSFPGITTGANLETLVTIGARDIGLSRKNSSSQIIEFFPNNDTLVSVNRSSVAISGSIAKRARKLVDQSRGVLAEWSAPEFADVPDPAGPFWRRNLSVMPDASLDIQKQIDAKGIAYLSAGAYYIDKSIILKRNQGIIGAGAGKTVIIAKSQNIDLIIGGDKLHEQTKTTRFILVDLTLQGGRNGIHHTASSSGKGADYNGVTLSNVTFRDMSEAGIFIENIYAWDNNLIDHVNFVNCKTGIKQRPDPLYIGGNRKGMTFLDKNLFYQCQFINNGLALDWPAKRANNLNGFVNCKFQGNGQVILQKNSNSTFFANSLFQQNAGSPAFETSHTLGIVHSHFQMGGADYLFNKNVICNDCFFERTSASQPVLGKPGERVFLTGSGSVDEEHYLSFGSGMIIDQSSSLTSIKLRGEKTRSFGVGNLTEKH